MHRFETETAVAVKQKSYVTSAYLKIVKRQLKDSLGVKPPMHAIHLGDPLRPLPASTGVQQASNRRHQASPGDNRCQQVSTGVKQASPGVNRRQQASNRRQQASNRRQTGVKQASTDVKKKSWSGMKRPVCLKVIITGKLVLSRPHQSPDLCGIFVQKYHFGGFGLEHLV